MKKLIEAAIAGKPASITIDEWAGANTSCHVEISSNGIISGTCLSGDQDLFQSFLDVIRYALGQRENDFLYHVLHKGTRINFIPFIEAAHVILDSDRCNYLFIIWLIAYMDRCVIEVPDDIAIPFLSDERVVNLVIDECVNYCHTHPDSVNAILKPFRKRLGVLSPSGELKIVLMKCGR